MNYRVAFAIAIGAIQGVIGVLLIILSFFISFNPNFLPMRTIFGLESGDGPFVMMLLLILGVFAVLSGLLIIHEWLSRS